MGTDHAQMKLEIAARRLTSASPFDLVVRPPGRRGLIIQFVNGTVRIMRGAGKDYTGDPSNQDFHRYRQSRVYLCDSCGFPNLSSADFSFVDRCVPEVLILGAADDIVKEFALVLKDICIPPKASVEWRWRLQEPSGILLLGAEPSLTVKVGAPELYVGVTDGITDIVSAYLLLTNLPEVIQAFAQWREALKHWRQAGGGYGK